MNRMTALTWPDSPSAFAEATWANLVPYYDELANRPLDNRTVESWLRDWTALEDLIGEAAALASVAYTCDTTDPAKERAHARFSSEIGPQLAEQRVRLAQRLLDLGYERPNIATGIRRFRNARDLFREENLPLSAALQRLNIGYQKRTGAMTVDWGGEEKTVAQLSPYLLDPDRAVRERAFRLRAQPYIAAHDELSALFDQQYALRQRVAANAGLANYRDYAHREKNRFDYSPADCEEFHAAVEETVVPFVAQRLERRRQQMGLDTIRPWDTGPDPLGRPPLQPFGDVSALIAHAATIFDHVDPTLGEYYRTMMDEGLLDLDSRRGKAPGGYCTRFAHRQRPFIFMNAVGVAGDVTTLLHEAGHAFHVFEADELPYFFQRHPGSEMAEVASMSMELLTAPYLSEAHGGYFSEADTRRARIEHLDQITSLLPHIASVDAFQHWIYTSGEGHDAAARDAAWLRIRQRFEPTLDWSGLEAERIARWYQQLHIFLYPFYYIEYGIAQIGALQVWRNSLRDPRGALDAYRRALALGGTAPLPDLFAAAGAKLAFDAETMGELVALIGAEIAKLEETG